jgi:hypothetical protein
VSSTQKANDAGVSHENYLEYEYTPGALTPQTIAVRVGSENGTLIMNVGQGGQTYGGTMACTLTVEEIKG